MRTQENWLGWLKKSYGDLADRASAQRVESWFARAQSTLADPGLHAVWRGAPWTFLRTARH
eukprot:1389352-Lingulodinium_polyedra.AAC.1